MQKPTFSHSLFYGKVIFWCHPKVCHWFYGAALYVKVVSRMHLFVITKRCFGKLHGITGHNAVEMNVFGVPPFLFASNIPIAADGGGTFRINFGIVTAKMQLPWVLPMPVGMLLEPLDDLHCMCERWPFALKCVKAKKLHYWQLAVNTVTT